MAANTTVQLNEFHTQCALKNISRGPGTYEVLTGIRANAMISSVHVSAISPGASLQINYYENTTGDPSVERYDLPSHSLVTDTITLPYTEKIYLPYVHSNVRMEAIVTGGNVTFGVLQTASEVSLIDSILAESGALPITTDLGTPYHLHGTVLTVENSKEEVLSFLVPNLTTRNLTQVVGTACEEGIFSLEVVGSGEILALFATTPSNFTVSFKFDPGKPIIQGTTVKLYFTANVDNGGGNAHGFVMASDVT